MAKIIIIFCSLLIPFLAIGRDTESNLKEKVVEIYTSQIGVHELSGKNDGPEVEGYLRVCGLPKGYAWCAAFVSWVFQKSGVDAIKSAWAPDWFKKNVIFKHGKSTAGMQMSPDQGDVFGIYFPTLKRVGHVGFIHNWNYSKSTVCTVEGNTNAAGSREGDGVLKKFRLKSQIYIISRWL